MSKEAMVLAMSWIQANAEHDQLCDILDLDDHGKHKPCSCGLNRVQSALREALAEQPAQQEPVAMRMPKVGDEVICIEDDSLGTVAYLTAGGSPEIRFDDGSHGTYVLREFAELFRYTTPQPAQQEPVAFYRCNGCGHAYEQVHPTSCDCMEGSSFEQVNYYTSPPAQRKPLTDEEWQNIADTLGCFINRGQKDAIEAALGIKENT